MSFILRFYYPILPFCTCYTTC